MKCRSVQQLLRGERDAGTEPRRRAELQAHLAECAECTAYQRDLELLHAWIRETPPAEPSAAFDWRLRLRLARADAGEIPPLFDAEPGTRHGWLQFAASAAAAAVLVVAVGLRIQPVKDDRGMETAPARTVSLGPDGGGRIFPVSDGASFGPQPALSYSYFLRDSAAAVPADSAPAATPQKTSRR